MLYCYCYKGFIWGLWAELCAKLDAIFPFLIDKFYEEAVYKKYKIIIYIYLNSTYLFARFGYFTSSIGASTETATWALVL